MPPIRVAVIGAGAFGRNHLRVYRELETAHPDLVTLAALVEPDPARRQTAAAQYSIPTFPSIAALLAANNLSPDTKSPSAPSALDPGPWTLDPVPVAVDAASICAPTTHHAAVAEQLLQANLDILIEKPIAASLEEADRIVTLAEKQQRIVAVGHLERFNPAVTAVAERLNNPMFFESHRLSIFTPRSLDVDVVLDLMIHDLDIVLSLTRSSVKEVRAVGIAILSRKADIANVRVEFESGCVANFTASRVSTEQVRKLRLFQPHQYLSLDFARQELLSIDVDPRAAQLASSGPWSLHPASTHQAPSSRPEAEDRSRETPVFEGASSAPSHPSAGLNLQKLDLPRAEPLRLELENFLHAIQTRTQPRVNASAGRAALALALEINREIAAHAQRAGLAKTSAPSDS